MEREKWMEMYETKKRINDLITARDAGLDYDPDELKQLEEHREKLWGESTWEQMQMDPETNFCFKSRFYDGMTYRQIMLLVYGGMKCESHARKRISRWFKKWESEGVEYEGYKRMKQEKEQQ